MTEDLLTIFKHALEKLGFHKNDYNYGMCKCVTYGLAVTHHGSKHTYGELWHEAFGLLIEYAGDNYNPNGFSWFPCTPEGRIQRVKLFESIINDLTIKLDKL
jgi:hypothetical protein